MAAQETGDQISKEETVYVNAGADGAVTDVTVSDWRIRIQERQRENLQILLTCPCILKM